MPTTSGKKGHIITGHTTLSQIAVIERILCTVIGRGCDPRPRQQGEGPMMEAGCAFFFFLCFGEGTCFERQPP